MGRTTLHSGPILYVKEKPTAKLVDGISDAKLICGAKRRIERRGRQAGRQAEE